MRGIKKKAEKGHPFISVAMAEPDLVAPVRCGREEGWAGRMLRRSGTVCYVRLVCAVLTLQWDGVGAWLRSCGPARR